MQFLICLAIAYYSYLGYKVLRQLYSVSKGTRSFYDEKMSFHLGMFVLVHVLAGIIYWVSRIMFAMVHAVN